MSVGERGQIVIETYIIIFESNWKVIKVLSFFCFLNIEKDSEWREILVELKFNTTWSKF